ASCAPASAGPPADPTYWQDIRPVLRKHCSVCHSTKNLNELDVSGGLALDSYPAIRKGTRQHPVIEPGKSDSSILIQRVTSEDDEKRMPLGTTPLKPEVIGLIRHWIDTGAKEGKNPDEHPLVTALPATTRTRKLDVTLPTTTIPPKDL